MFKSKIIQCEVEQSRKHFTIFAMETILINYQRIQQKNDRWNNLIYVHKFNIRY